MSKELVPQQIFIKGKKYTNQAGSVVLCSKTTCNYSSKSFKGVVLEGREYPAGYYSKWLTLNFVELITLT